MDFISSEKGKFHSMRKILITLKARKAATLHKLTARSRLDTELDTLQSARHETRLCIQLKVPPKHVEVD
jgi:hypothetical protein